MNSLSHSCLVSLLGACLLASTLNAQEPVRILSGTVSNAQGEPLSASIVQLTDSTQAAGYRGLAETDSVGRFHVEVSGPVNRLLVSRLGYQMQAVPVAAGQDSYAIVLARNAEMQLDEVSVTANRKVVQVMPSGIAYDMQHSPAKSGEMLDALRFVPLLSVSPTGEISVVGKSGGVAYYVDGRKLRLEGEALAAYLRTLRAEDVKSVEVLTAPDGRFQEPVDCGVVNIVTRQGELEGLKGAVNARLSQSHYTDADGSVMLTYGRGRFSASVFAFGSLN